MGYSRIGWAGGIIAPWWLGLALAVSMTADAGQEASSGASLSPLPLRAPLPPAELIPAGQSAQSSGLAIDFGGLSGEVGKLLRQASLSIGNDEEFRRLPDEVEPRAVLKRNARLFPSIDRSHKGDPLAGLRSGSTRACARRTVLRGSAPGRRFSITMKTSRRPASRLRRTKPTLP
jgi:hypothetical protein